MLTTKSASWEEAKDIFNKIPKDFVSVLAEYKKNKPERVRETKQPKGTMYEIEFGPILGFDCFLDIHDFNDQRKQTRALYTMFDNGRNRSVVRRSWIEGLEI